MKLKNNFFYTLRENVKDEESNSANLLYRSGMIKKIGNGIFTYMPIGNKVIKKIENIIREEMNNTGAVELLMPSLIPTEYYEKSNRLDVFGNGIFKLNDRYDRNYVLGPTHEELFALAAKESIQSYKDFPFNLYQIGRKYRDEPRPRYGLIRVREFIMKDAYSFDKDLAGLDESYNKMYQAYSNIFNRAGLEYKIVKADTGAMGGILSEEFQALAEIGEDTLVLCNKCDYASNIEVSECIISNKDTSSELEKELVHTPNSGTIEDVTKFLNRDTSEFVKTLIYKVEDELVACMVRASREVNETKVLKLLNKTEINLAESKDVEEATNAKVGFAGPIGLNIKTIVDQEVLNMKNFIVGANQTDYHFINVNVKDFEYTLSGDIKNIIEGDKCPKCGGEIYFKKGIEIGNTFKLGTKYAEAMNVFYADQENTLKPTVMGSYGIGVERIMTSIVEQNNDESGIIWPMAVAPFEVAVVLISEKDDKQNEVANFIYNNLQKNNVDVLLDNRDERPGIKFNDIELIGIPIRITVGKKVAEDIVEVTLRKTKETTDVKIDELDNYIKELIKNHK